MISRLLCRLLGHRWVTVYGHELPFAPIAVMQVCERPGCRGRDQGTRYRGWRYQ